MKMDCEIQNICVNLFERCRDYKCKSLFADGEYQTQAKQEDNVNQIIKRRK